ncbi:MAG TPA: aldehyde dehydrogenase family protein [Actinophytocola sp.]|jgi:acyl-CoA reductase-like NAD-dependent aldehyde dehydrogenase|uniref:aldehyde dehydrogenase family protein n=1 Tax=Actinophytocola sp. TaxID=1872138 RepID=UPI002E06A990|nr:aldehyde dehydrogenase family protein [Actinophytocola sp.]
MRTYPLYLDGQDVETGKWIHTVAASAFLRDSRAAFDLKRALDLDRGAVPTSDVAGRVAIGDDSHNLRAIAAARAAARGYRELPLETRRQILLDFHYALLERVEEVIQILVAEGHPRRLAQWELSGVLRATDPDTIDWYVSQLHQEFFSAGRLLELVRRPDGVVCVNPPQNAAGSNSVMGMFALLAGNTLVVKAPRSSPLSVLYLYRDVAAPILDKHGAPPGTLNIICGSSPRIVRTWLDSPDVDDILFFGDSTAGLKLGREAVARGKKPILELAGNDGFVVWHDADLEAAARALTEAYYGSGQICMVPKYAVVHPSIVDDFLRLFVPRVKALRPGYPEDPDTVLSPVLKADRYFDFLAEATEAGCPVLCGGRRLDVEGNPAIDGAFLEPTVVRVDGLTDARRLSCVREETFFPLLPVVVPAPAENAVLLERIVGLLNANPYGLRNSVWTCSDEVAGTMAAAVVNGGLLKINDSHIGFTSYLATHGGTGLTGGPFGELNYAGLRTTHLQGICWGDGDPRPLEPEVLR